MGDLLGHGVRFGRAAPVMAAGEGIETALSLRMTMPGMATIAALSAAHLGALAFPPQLRRLYVAREQDVAGEAAFATLAERAASQGIEVLPLDSVGDDFNTDLVALGRNGLVDALRLQLHREDPYFLR